LAHGYVHYVIVRMIDLSIWGRGYLLVLEPELAELYRLECDGLVNLLVCRVAFGCLVVDWEDKSLGRSEQGRRHESVGVEVHVGCWISA